ncbi:MAG: ABC transporter substrate-binding protein [Acidimicrobiales bacterium]
MTFRPTPRRSAPWRLLAILLGLTVLAAACGDSADSDTSAGTTESTAADDTGTTAPADDATSDDATTDEATTGDVPDGPTITIGAQDFGESTILAEVYGQALTAAGYPVGHQAVGGFRDVSFAAFESGDVNFTVEYAASALEYLNQFAGEASSDLDATVTALDAQLETRGIVAMAPSEAVDSNAFVVNRPTADGGVTKISDLTEDLTLGGPQDCEENTSCIPGLEQVYGIDLSANFVPLDGSGPLTVAALAGNEVDVAVLFSTNGAIAANDFVVLEDDKGMIAADNIIPIASDEVFDAYGQDLVDLVDSISSALTTEELTEMNKAFDIDYEDAETIAADWLTANGFGE